MSTLYIAAIDIGNRNDNTPRIIETIKSVDIVLVESYKEGSTFLKHIGVKKDMLEISEHSKDKDVDELIETLLRKDAVLISDCGTPLVEDPGRAFVRKCYDYNIKVVPLPGVSSITASLMVCPFNIKEFYYAGLLPRNDKERINKLKSLKYIQTTIIILDTPYRLEKVLAACAKIFGNREAILAMNLTQEKETVLLDSVHALSKKFAGTGTKKSEFVLVIDNSK